MKKLPKNAYEPLDDEEKELMQSVEAGEWQAMSVEESKKMTKILKNATPYKMEKRQITIQLGSADIDFVKSRAVETGIPYQNIIGALVHNYAAGKIKLEV